MPAYLGISFGNPLDSNVLPLGDSLPVSTRVTQSKPVSLCTRKLVGLTKETTSVSPLDHDQRFGSLDYHNRFAD
jgi:hypothetical protein